jgi:RNA polymerase sigma-70 factor (ECF subfamily)
VRRHQAAVFRFAMSLTKDNAAAEDALQETFLAAYRGAGRFRDDSSVKTWLMTIARNAVYRQNRRRAGEPADFVALSELGRAAGWGANDGGRFVELLARRDLLDRAMSALSGEDREMLVLRELEGLTLSEAATVTGTTEAAAKTRLHRARLRLMAKIREALDHGR